MGWVPRENEDPSDIDSDSEDPQENHLRSVREVLGYSAHTDDGDIGKVVDLLVGSTAWQIRRLILDLNTWLPGGLVEIQSEEILDVSWEEQHFVLPIEKSEIRSRSEYDRKLAVNVDE